MLNILITIVTILFIFEILVYFLFVKLKRDFNWLIDKENLNPKFEKIKFKNFLNKNFDKITGWDRKPNTNGFEVSTKKTFFKINKSGHRGNKKYKKDGYYVFGDSFAFCRYVNDNQTWEYHLSKKVKKMY